MAAPAALAGLADVDGALCLCSPPDFTAVGAYYSQFAPITDVQVRSLLAAGERGG